MPTGTTTTHALGTVLLLPDSDNTTKIGWLNISQTTCYQLADFLATHPEQARMTSLTIDNRFQDNLAAPDGIQSACRKPVHYAKSGRARFNDFLSAKAAI